MFLHIILCWDFEINDVLIYKYRMFLFAAKCLFSSLNMGQCQKFKVPLTVLQDVGRLKFEKVFTQKSLLFNCLLSTFQGEVSCKA